MAKKRTLTKAKKKKLWYNIIAPKEFKSAIVGETLALDPNSLVNRKIKVSLSNLTGDPKKQSTEVTLEVIEVKGSEAHTKVIKYKLSSTSVKRLIRTGKTKLDDSFIVKSKDKVKLRIKPLIITRKKVKNSIATDLRRKSKEDLIKQVSSVNLDVLTNSIMFGKLQRELRDSLAKVYPLRNYQIRVLELVK